MGLVVLIASGVSLILVVKTLLQVPIEGSILLFVWGGFEFICDNVDWYFYGDDCTFHASVWFVDDLSVIAIKYAFWRDDSARKVCLNLFKTLC